MWPNKKNEQENDQLLNYYGVHDPDSRLYPISQLDFIQGTSKPAFIQYFENMSRAMANMCTGQIYLLTQTPENLQQYSRPPLSPNIWSTTEYKALTSHLLTLTGSLIVINASDTSDKPKAWTADWHTLQLRDPANYRRDGGDPMEGWEPYDLDGEREVAIRRQQQKRANDLCIDSGIDDEPPGMDFFG